MPGPGCLPQMMRMKELWGLSEFLCDGNLSSPFSITMHWPCIFEIIHKHLWQQNSQKRKTSTLYTGWQERQMERRESDARN